MACSASVLAVTRRPSTGGARGERRRDRGDIGHVDPAALGRRLQHGVDDRLAAHAVVERGRAGPPLHDGLDEGKVLVVAEGRRGVALVGVAGRAGIGQELARHGDRLQRAVGPADLHLVRPVQVIDQGALGAVDLELVEPLAPEAAPLGHLADVEGGHDALLDARRRARTRR